MEWGNSQMAAGTRELPRDVLQAFHDTCFTFGVEELAGLMGVSRGVLYNKCDVGEGQHHKPTLQDALLVQVITGDKRIAQAMSRLLNGVFVDLSGMQAQSDEALLDLVAVWMKEQGDLFARWQEAYGDGHISQADYRRIRKEALDVVAAVMTFVARVEGLQR